MTTSFRKAKKTDESPIWAILQDAILQRKADGSDQWQDGYPNPQTIASDIEKNVGYVLVDDDLVVGYASVLVNDEPAYNDLQGAWLTQSDFVVFHRVAIAKSHIGKGLSYELLHHIETVARSLNIKSIRADTNFDNYAMMRVLENTGYRYCGEVLMRGSPRKAYEKVLNER